MAEMFFSYFETTAYLIVLLLFLVYLFVHRQDELLRHILYAYVIFGVLYPIVYVFCKLVGQNAESYRFLWLFPLSVIWALGMVVLWNHYGESMGAFLVLAVITMVVLGTILLSSRTWQGISNEYALDNEVIYIAQMIEKEEASAVRIIGEPQIMVQIRQYSAMICWAYSGRDPMIWAGDHEINDTYRDNCQYRLAMAIQQGEYLDEEALESDLRSLDTKYIVISKDNGFVDHLSKESYSLLGMVGQYKIYQMVY